MTKGLLYRRKRAHAAMLHKRAITAALRNMGNPRRARKVTTSWARRNRAALLDWARCLLWAAPRAALWAAIIWGGLSWFLAALEEERAWELAAREKQQEAMQAWREDVDAKRTAALHALQEREEAANHANR